MNGRVLRLAGDLAAAILKAAAKAYPAECCGLLEGTDTEDGWCVLAVHEAANLAQAPQRHFLIDPQLQFELLRLLRGAKRRVIGCYHSHPGGSPSPSAIDAAGALEADFLWLIAGGAPDAGFTLRAYVFADERFTPVPILER